MIVLIQTMHPKTVSLSLACLLQWECASGESPIPPSFIETYCYECHDGDSTKGNLDLERTQKGSIAEHGSIWEKVLRKMDARQMPPIGNERPSEDLFEEITSDLAVSLDQWATLHPNPGRTETIRRLTRTEYQNAIRDLLAVRVDTKALLPKDEASHGFDNITVGNLSPTLLNRYISAAQKISRLAVGASHVKPGGQTYRIPADVTQESHVEGLPLGTRGGLLIPHKFTHDAEYEIRVRLARDRNEVIEGLNGSYELDILMDDQRIRRFKVGPPKTKGDYDSVDGKLSIRVPVKAGLRRVGVTFADHSDALLERKRQPYRVAFNMHRHPRLSPSIYQVSINGPFKIQGSGETASRAKIFIEKPQTPAEEDQCAKRILSHLMRRAYRRPITSEDLIQPLRFYRQEYAKEGFEAGIETALSAILISPQFLLRIENEPHDVLPDTPYKVSDLELATRLSFFLWSSIPDETLLDLASHGALSKGDELTRQTKRMLRDPRAKSLVTNFADQWLYLRNLDSLTPDARLFPDFDENLRKALRKETEMLFGHILKEDRSVLELLQCNYTFLNERLARHYSVPGIHGSHFRKVALKPEMHRGGVLRHGSILAVTSYATRTSPVIRGHWILGNLLGSPPPPPPPNIPALEETSVDASLSVRERFAEHRANAACARCHDVLDPVGFVLENFDAVGRWRDMENGRSVDASGGFSDGSQFEGVEALEEAILRRPKLFVQTLSEKLLTYALGRGIETYDAPAVRRIIRHAEEDDFRLSSIILGVVRSQPFQMRKTLP